MSQTSVNAAGQPFGVAGQIADSGPFDIVSGFSRETVNQLPFGIGLMNKPGEQDGYYQPTGLSGIVEIHGVNVFSHNHARGGLDSAGNPTGDVGGTGLMPNASLEVMRKGRVIVPVAPDVRVNDRAFCYVTPTGARYAGLWTGTGLGGSFVRDVSAQGVFRSKTYLAADGTTRVAILECDFTAKSV